MEGVQPPDKHAHRIGFLQLLSTRYCQCRVRHNQGSPVTQNKNTSKTKNTAKKSKTAESTASPTTIGSIIRTWLIRDLWKVIVVMLLALVAYGIYLDAQIKHTFSGNKWQVPSQIYARALNIESGAELTSEELRQELTLLGYRSVTRPLGAGEFSYHNHTFRIVRRAFSFPDQPEPERFIEVVIAKGKVKSVKDLDKKTTLRRERLEPWLVTRLTSGSQEDRMLMGLQDVPDGLIAALLATEDKDFYHHQGVAPVAILRALVANILAGRAVQGGSTLTQQLVKNLYLTREKSLLRKLNEAYMALLLDYHYSKDTILEAYLNEVFLGQNGKQAIHGFGLASWFYFNRPLNEINLAQISALVAMVKGPSRYNPRKYPQRVLERRDLVLRLLYEQEVISGQDYEYYVQQPLGVVSASQLQKPVHPAFMDKVARELRQILPEKSWRQAGIKVFTTLDPHVQLQAEKAAERVLKRLESTRKLSDLNIASVISDIKSGEIRAIVGGRKVALSGFNRALDAKRAIGSLVKPAVYLTALDAPEQYNLASLLEDQPIRLKSSYGNYWEPKNIDKTFRGRIKLLDSLVLSLNVPTVHLGMALGTNQVADTLSALGVPGTIPLYPAMLLGAIDLSPLQVNQMYQSIANEGARLPLHSITAVTSNADQLLWRFSEQSTQAINAASVYLLNYALQRVTKFGTAKLLKQRFPKLYLAGKTGTSDDYRDSWFSGFDNDLVSTIWIGKDNNQPTTLTGASGALRYYAELLEQLHPRSLSQSFPADLAIAQFDPQTGAVVAAGCKDSISLPAVMSSLPPANTCDSTPVEQEDKGFWQRLFGR